MGTTAQKLQAIQSSKAAIKSAIEAKGVSDVGDVLSTYATKIASIPAGASGDPRYEVTAQGALSKKSFALNYFNDLTSIPYNGLYYAYYQSNVTSVSFPNVTSVGNNGMQNAFYECTALTSVNMSEVTTVGSNGMNVSFRGCTSLTSIDLSSLSSVGQSGLYSCFYGCTSLTSIDLSSLSSIGTNVLNGTFYNCTSLTSVDLSSVTSVTNNGLASAFYGCTSLRTVLLKKLSSASSAFASAFYNCRNLELVDFSEATAVPALNNVNAFQNTNSTFKIVVPDDLYSSWTTASNWSNFANQIVKVSDYTPAS